VQGGAILVHGCASRFYADKGRRLTGKNIELKCLVNNVVEVEGRNLSIEFAEFITFPERQTQIWETD